MNEKPENDSNYGIFWQQKPQTIQLPLQKCSKKLKLEELKHSKATPKFFKKFKKNPQIQTTNLKFQPKPHNLPPENQENASEMNSKSKIATTLKATHT